MGFSFGKEIEERRQAVDENGQTVYIIKKTIDENGQTVYFIKKIIYNLVGQPVWEQEEHGMPNPRLLAILIN